MIFFFYQINFFFSRPFLGESHFCWDFKFCVDDCTYDDKGTAYSGGANSLIHCWRNRQLAKAYQVHNSGFVGAIKIFENRVYSGGKDGCIIISNPNTAEIERRIEVGSLIRAIDYLDGNIVVGSREGTICEIDQSDTVTTLMNSHSAGEAWGLALTADGKIVSSGDDNKIMVWSIYDKRLLGQAIVSEESKKSKRGGASTLSTLPPSKCARAVAVNNLNGHVAVASNSGLVSIRESVDALDSEIAKMKHSLEWIEVLKYSPCGTMLASGSHDNKIYVYDVDNGYSLKYTCKGHNSYITSVDWSEDSSIIRSVCGAYELLFFDGSTGSQETGGGSSTVDTVWATNSAKFGWCVDGIFPGNTDGTHVNDVDWSSDGNLVITADDYGLVNVYRNPVRKGHQPRSYRAHSEHVVRARFNYDASQIISIGGFDKTIMIWTRE